MTTDIGRSPDGSGYSAEPEPGCTVSAVPVSIPNAEQLTVTEFICAIRDRFIKRAALAPENAVDAALAALEVWEESEGAAELTKDCANEIADADLEHWDD